MNVNQLVREVMTGPDNQTLAWGRVMGAIVFVLFIVVLPWVLLVLVALHKLSIADAQGFMTTLAVFLPAAALTAWSFVTATGMFEPKAGRGGGE